MTEPVTSSAPRALRRTLLAQSWLDVSMLHWPADPDLVQRLIPAGTRPDLLHGQTYVGLIGFRMHHLGIGPRPGLPYLGNFLETNVRLYTVDGAGRRGVFFCSLDASRLAAVLGGRYAAQVPYVWSRMRFRRDGDVVKYWCRRRWPDAPATSRMQVRIGRVLTEPSELEHFLTARWGLHTSWYGRSIYLPNVHDSWPLHAAECVDLVEDSQVGLLARAGFAVSGPPASVLYSAGVSVRFGTPSPVPPSSG
jgi:uncharacterized protein YqjF (DUF2071 family)